jgi:hypothetical protein
MKAKQLKPYQNKKTFHKEKTNIERVQFFLGKNCRRVAIAFAKAHFLKSRPRRRYPEFYEDVSGKGRWGGKFDHPEVVAAAEDILKQYE